MRTGFIGLGNLGKAIAQRLISQGEHLTVWNRTLEKAKGLECTVAESVGQLVERTDVVFLNLFDSKAVRDVLTGRGGIVQAGINGKTIVDTTTNHYRQVVEFHRIVAEAGGRYLEAPVMGSVVPASQGALVMLVSGGQETLDLVTPLLRKFCKNVYMLGAPGLATRMKLINNLVLGSYMVVLAEAVAWGETVGLERAKVLDILANGAGNSAVLNAKKEKLLNLDFSPHFSASAIEKDMRYLQEMADEIGKDFGIGPCVWKAFQETIERGLAKEDFAAVYKVMRG